MCSIHSTAAQSSKAAAPSQKGLKHQGYPWKLLGKQGSPGHGATCRTGVGKSIKGKQTKVRQKVDKELAEREPRIAEAPQSPAEETDESLDWGLQNVSEDTDGAQDTDSIEDTEYVSSGDSEVIAGYGSESSTEETRNTIGGVSLDKYAGYPHIGYDINGRKIMRPATKTAVDSLLEAMDKEGWTGVISKETGEEVRLTAEELDLVRKIQQGRVPDDEFDPYEAYIDYFSGQVEKMPLSARPEPKRRFVPSKHEQAKIIKIVRAIREGRIVLKSEADWEKHPVFYDIWSDASAKTHEHIMHIPAPKMPLPIHSESYNPPEEYLPSDDEIDKWNHTLPEDRETNYLPSKYRSLRLVPGYDRFMQERFERCLDLYLAPRVRRNRLNIDPDSLLPKLPPPEDLRPFPTRCSTVYKGHEGRVRSIDVDSSGLWLASGGDDCVVRVWEVITGKEMWRFHIENTDNPVDSLAWRPTKNSDLISVSCGNHVYMLLPSVLNDKVKDAAKELSTSGFNTDPSQTAKTLATWSRPSSTQVDRGLVLSLNVKKRVRRVVWHRQGDYFVTLAPENGNTAVLVHLLSKHQSQTPFKKIKGLVQTLAFHPTKPLFFVATQRYVRVYNLVKQELVKIIQPGLRWISSIDIHPQGDNLILGSYDKKLAWIDMDLSPRPYKTLCYHTKALRSVAFHKGIYPLFCSASDDGSIHVFHGMVYNDLMQNPLLVPLKILKGHEITCSLGILDVQWHPRQPWLFSSGADATIRLWT
ncbi:uncharacterized protein T551_02133 [Pneumocystis jirovecii RU7]|uniref:Ribosome biogenesis protein ERB1 n=1 Tax=Pneumocystis jirovecii (strain RU7) TaxID=1408657 RepID=A0A0W4ZMB4_PNEJ7|nr:uncharacterized protein T551_02133 [Pneumocystis jirovecii RU7]KTW29517.1 hypothetical protein T551_02133 [Pneumocystis jirovecii RU7]